MTKRVGLAAPHPAAHKCAIVPFRLPKRLFAYVFAESLHDFAKQGHKRPGMRTAARFFLVFCSGDVSRSGESETLYLVVGTTTLFAKKSLKI